ncbi:pilus assembly protein N-terminal domain-containing protein [Magnetospirillum sp. SS-4]|uniref:pilus assembly protein N-terminal domain-containing protein n=1 Tax=Magnetospirillum sp. SS-4 TaxID=2681465 RepID=UPI0020C302D0|nr:pilus assembly protein N-terminal domain-containing protein [Magnetospirillum sp. SS-4]
MALLAAGLLAAPAAWAGESIVVPLGGAVAVPLKQAARQVVVGNPAIADVTVQGSRGLTLFGKYPGGTTLSVIDGAGKVVFDATVVVSAGGGNAVTVRYGTGKTWQPGGVSTVVECAPERCSPPMGIPSETPYKSGSAPAAASAPASAPAR